MSRVLILGGTGMLGSMITDVLSRETGLEVISTLRRRGMLAELRKLLPEVEWQMLDVSETNRDELRKLCSKAEWVINAIGMTKPYTHDDNAFEIERAIKINALFTYDLAHAAMESGAKILQIATDCVYDGSHGLYKESDVHNPLDVYGKTKSLGESLLQNVYCLRCSIIGPEPKEYAFLLEWFRRQPRNATVNGFTNHVWNGVTTMHFAKICHGIIKNGLSLPHIQHIVPTGTITKYELLKTFAAAYHREDINVMPTEAAIIIDRTLATENEVMNRMLWKSANYENVPSVPQMVMEMSEFPFRMEAT